MQPRKLNKTQLGVLLAALVRDPAGGLSDDLTELNKGQAQHSIPVKICPRALFDKVRCFAGMVEHLAEADGVVMQHRWSPLHARPCLGNAG